jgi:hypothetical protein
MRWALANSADAVGALHFSRAAEADGDFTGFDDDRHLARSIRDFEHARQPLVVFEDIDVLVGNLTAGKCLPGTRSVRSEIFAEDKNFFIHVHSIAR